MTSKNLLPQLIRLSEELELDQSQKPLTKKVKSLSDKDELFTFAYLLLNLDDCKDLEAILGLSINLPENFNFSRASSIIISFQSQGFSYKTQNEIKEFQSKNDFDESLLSIEQTSRLELCLESPSEFHHLQIHVLTSLKTLSSSQAISYTAAHCNFLVLNGSSKYIVEDSAPLKSLLKQMPVVLPVINGPVGGDDQVWWKNTQLINAENCLMPILTIIGLKPIDIFKSKEHTLLTSIQENSFSSWLSANFNMIKRSIKEKLKDTKDHTNNAKLELLFIDENNHSFDINKKMGSEIREFIKEELKELRNSTDIELKRSFFSSLQSRHLINEIDKVLLDDISQNAEGKRINLSVNSTLLKNFNDNIEDLLNVNIERSIKHIHDSVKLLENKLKPFLVKMDTQVTNISYPDLAHEKISLLKEFRKSLNLQYTGEMNKRTFIQRVSEGRRSVYGVLMMVSLFGGVFGINRNSATLTYLMVGLFVGGVLFSYFSWKKEDDATMDKELQKIKSSLNNELDRAYQSLQKECQSVMTSWIAEIEKAYIKHLDDLNSKSQDKLKNEQQNQKEKFKLRLSNLDVNLRSIEKLIDKCRDFETDLESFTSQVKRSLKEELIECQEKGL